MKIIISDMKNTLDGINGKLNIPEEKFNESEDKAIEAIQWDLSLLRDSEQRASLSCEINSSGLSSVQFS